MHTIKMKCPCCSAILELKRMPANKNSVVPCRVCGTQVPFSEYKSLACFDGGGDVVQHMRRNTPRGDTPPNRVSANVPKTPAEGDNVYKQAPAAAASKKVMCCPYCNKHFIVPNKPGVKNKRFKCSECEGVFTIAQMVDVPVTPPTPPTPVVSDPEPPIEKVEKECPVCHTRLIISMIEGIEEGAIVCAKCHQKIPFTQLIDPGKAPVDPQIVEGCCPHCKQPVKLPKSPDIEGKRLSCKKCKKSAFYEEFVSGELQPVEYRVFKCKCHAKSDVSPYYLFVMPQKSYKAGAPVICNRCKKDAITPKAPDDVHLNICTHCGSKFITPREYCVSEYKMSCPTCSNVVTIDGGTIHDPKVQKVGYIVHVNGRNRESHKLVEGENIIGRDVESSRATIRIKSSNRMSRQHLIINVEKINKSVIHKASLVKEKCNPVMINGQKVVYGEEVILNNDDIIKVADVTLNFVVV